MKIAIVLIHGMGYQTAGYSQKMQEGLTRYYSSFGEACQSTDLIMKEVLWSPAIKEQQERLFRKITDKRGLRYRMLRRFFVDYLGDAVAYQARCNVPDPDEIQMYQLIHGQIDFALAQLSEHPEIDAQHTPLIFIGHSLGTVILSNYIWDKQHYPTEGLPPFENCRTLTGLFTMGSPMALWSLRFVSLGDAIDFPGYGLTPHLKKMARWYNFYDRSDIIAYPLKSINDDYEKSVSADVPVNVGGMLYNWNPLSHMGYWKSRAVQKYISHFLANLQLAQQETQGDKRHELATLSDDA